MKPMTTSYERTVGLLVADLRSSVVDMEEVYQSETSPTTPSSATPRAARPS
jgi:hypothetical protein